MWQFFSGYYSIYRYTHRKKYKIFLIVLADTIVNPAKVEYSLQSVAWGSFVVISPAAAAHLPRTMVVHFSYTSLTDGTMVGSFWFDATALRTFEKHLAFFEAELLYHLFGCVPFRNGTLSIHTIENRRTSIRLWDIMRMKPAK